MCVEFGASFDVTVIRPLYLMFSVDELLVKPNVSNRCASGIGMIVDEIALSLTIFLCCGSITIIEIYSISGILGV